MPFRAHGVSTTGFWLLRDAGSRPFQRAKKNVLFLTMGPPKLAVYSLRLVQLRVTGVPALRLFAHVFGSRAELVTFHTAEPRYWFVPDFVRSCICELPRPTSASTGARIIFTSPI